MTGGPGPTAVTILADLPSLAPFGSPPFFPCYRPLSSGEWELRISDLNFVPGYWSGSWMMADVAALVRQGGAWMSMTPFEVESQIVGIHLAKGDVLIFGLGMGWAASACAFKPEVRSVTVVEMDPDVLALHRELDLFAQLPEPARAKVRLIEGDARTYVPDGAIDLLMPDIWLPLVGEDRLEEVRLMQANVGAARIYFWGQEMEIARHAAARGRELDARGLKATIGETGLPLIGGEIEDYCGMAAAAARRWMGDRWLNDRANA